jgi:DHA2 family multidrug resistance protein
MLILARILQGAGGGALLPLSQAILLESFPREKQGMAMAMFGLGVVGPRSRAVRGRMDHRQLLLALGIQYQHSDGILADLYDGAIRSRTLPTSRRSRPGPIDGIGFGLLTVWLATLQIVLDKGQQEDWFASTWITWFSVISVAALGALIVRELRTPEPIVDLRVFLDRNFWVGTGVTFLVMGGMYSALTMLPLFLQTLLGYTAQNSPASRPRHGVSAR